VGGVLGGEKEWLLSKDLERRVEVWLVPDAEGIANGVHSCISESVTQRVGMRVDDLLGVLFWLVDTLCIQFMKAVANLLLAPGVPSLGKLRRGCRSWDGHR
jgi:hypothetical protein